MPVDPPSVSQIKILLQSLVENDNVPPCIQYRPELALNYNNQTYAAFLDSGTYISAIFESL